MLVLAGCGGEDTGAGSGETVSESTGDPDAVASAPASCLADATALDSLPADFPDDFPFPRGTVVYAAQDLGSAGIVVTGVTDASLKDTLADLNGPAQKAGFTITTGETEDNDAEANWAGNGFTGRWAIRRSATCDGEVSVQVLASPA